MDFVSVYHSSPVPRQTSAFCARASDAASISGGTSPPTAMTPSTRRAVAAAARNAIATPCENPANTSRAARAISRDLVEHAFDVGEVVGDRQIAILPRHPARDDLVGAPLVEAVQSLNRHQPPAIGAGIGACVRSAPPRLRRSHGTDEQTAGAGVEGGGRQIAPVRGGRDVAFDYQMTFTTPEPRISASRVMSGSRSARRRADQGVERIAVEPQLVGEKTCSA